MKKGRFSKDEIEIITQHAAILDVNEIGETLNRDPESVRTFIVDKLGLLPLEPAASRPDISKVVAPEATKMVRRAEPAQRAAVSLELRKTEMWRRLKDEFEESELTFLEERYVAMVDQFETVFATEETQMLQCIKLEILMSRNLQQRKKALQSIRFIEESQSEMMEEYCPGGDRSNITKEQLDQLCNIETQLNAARSDEQSKTAEYDKLSSQHTKLMQSLKATRDQRLDKIESTKVNFLDVIRQLNDRDIQEREGRQMELMRIAGERELIRLGRPITYDDGNQDSPILCPETVNLGPDE